MSEFEFEFPDPGEGLTEGDIVEWHVSEGDAIEEDDVLCEVETDKATSDVPSPRGGTVTQINFQEGETVEVGEVLCVIDTEGGGDESESDESGEAEESEEESEDEEAAEEESEDEEAADEEAGDSESEEEAGSEEDESESEPREADEESEPAVEASGDGESEEGESAEPESSDGEGGGTADEGRVFAAPRTRKFAREQGVDLASVDGSGPNGRVLQSDIEQHLNGEGGESEGDGEAVEAGGEGVIDHPTTQIEPVSVDADEERSERRDLSGLRGRIAENMVRSKTVTAQLTSTYEADAEALVELKERLDEKHDAHVTYTPLFVKAVVPALKEFPIVNSSLDDTTGEVVEKHYYNVGVATHTEDGLMVPVVHDADTKSIVDVAEELGELAGKARDRSIGGDEMQGGTFTVTNLALDGEHLEFGTPVINHPEAAILGIGPIKEKPVATEDGEVEVRNRVTLSLTYDHRLVDGVTANRFAEYVIEGLEDPDILLSRL